MTPDLGMRFAKSCKFAKTRRMPYRPTVNEPALTHSQRMWFATVLVLLAVVMLLAACRPAAEPRLPTTKNWGVARLSILVDGKEEGFCTVWKIHSGMAITAGHCCTDAEEVMEERREQRELMRFWQQLLNDGEEGEEEIVEKRPVVEFTAHGNMAVKGAKFEVLRDDDANDVCVLKGPMNGLPIALAKQEPRVGEKVWTEGYPRGTFLISEGYWSGMYDADTMVASTAIWGGASGSPVMNADGEAVGLLTRYRPPMSNMTLMTPLEWLVANVTNAQRKLASP